MPNSATYKKACPIQQLIKMHAKFSFSNKHVKFSFFKSIQNNFTIQRPITTIQHFKTALIGG
jgi:hypothetical protein